MDKTIIKMMEQIFEKEEGSVKLQDEFREYEEWDSLALFGLLAAIEDKYKKTISREEFKTLRTVQDIVVFCCYEKTK